MLKNHHCPYPFDHSYCCAKWEPPFWMEPSPIGYFSGTPSLQALNIFPLMSLILYYKDKWVLDCELTQCKAWETVKSYLSVPFDEMKLNVSKVKWTNSTLTVLWNLGDRQKKKKLDPVPRVNSCPGGRWGLLMLDSSYQVSKIAEVFEVNQQGALEKQLLR